MPNTILVDDHWQRLTADLAPCLAALDEDEFLILACKTANYYVQFHGRGKFGMRAEAASNSYVEPPQAVLTVEDYERMAALGWHRPTNPPPELATEPPPPEGSPNFFADRAAPVDWAEVAALTTRTFREVYHLQHPRFLEYTAFARNGMQLKFPLLLLRRRTG